MKYHHTITFERTARAFWAAITTSARPGFCINCGAEVQNVEPDAHDHPCEDCKTRTVWGAEELMVIVD